MDVEIMKLGFFTQPVHPITRDYREILREDQEAIILADELGYCDAFVGEHMTDLAEPITNCLVFLATLIPNGIKLISDPLGPS